MISKGCDIEGLLYRLVDSLIAACCSAYACSCLSVIIGGKRKCAAITNLPSSVIKTFNVIEVLLVREDRLKRVKIKIKVSFRTDFIISNTFEIHYELEDLEAESNSLE